MADEIARAGLGVELEGGSAVIADLRTIHSTLAGIVSLASSIPKNLGPTLGIPSGRQSRQGFDAHVQAYRGAEKAKTQVQAIEHQQRERQEREHQSRIRREEAQRRRTGPVSDTDVRTEVRSLQRRRELRERANAELTRIDEKEFQRKERLAQRERQLLEQSYAEQARLRRDRVSKLSLPEYRQASTSDRERRLREGQFVNPYAPDVRYQRQILQAGRNDPAAINDPTTIGYRNQLARDIRAGREYNRQHIAARRDQARELSQQLVSDPVIARYIAEGNLGAIESAQRRQYRQARTDPAARTDETTRQWRDQMATRLRAARIARDQFRPQIEEFIRGENQLFSRIERDSDLRAGRGLTGGQLEAQTRRRDVRESRALREQQGTYGGGFRQYAARSGFIERQAQLESFGTRNIGPSAFYAEFGSRIERDKTVSRDLVERYKNNLTTTVKSVQKTEQDVLREYLRGGGAGRLTGAELAGVLSGEGPGGPGGPPPVGPGGGGGRRRSRPQAQAALRDPQGLFNERGFFTSTEAVGRITRNILLYQAVAGLTYGLGDYVTKAIQAAKTTVEFSNALRFATEQAGGNIGANERLADSLLQVGLSRQQGRAAVTEAARFAEERPQDTEALTRTVADIAASRGVGVDRTDELIEQLRRRESKFYKRIFGTTVESIYEEFAGQVVDTRTASRISNPQLYIGDDTKIKSRSEAIRSYVENMKDAEKETAVFNYILSQSSRFEGEAAERANTLAGRLDKMSSAWLNAQEGIGIFITEIGPLNRLLDQLTSKVGFLDTLRGPSLSRTGPGGTISNLDVTQYASDVVSSPRTQALADIDQYGGTAFIGGLGLGAAALLGRSRAKELYRLSSYNKVFDEYVTKFNGNLVAAQNEAVRAAKDLRPGFARSVGSGLQRVTVGMSDAISSITGTGPISARFGPDVARSISNFNVGRFRQPYGAEGIDLGAQGPFSSLRGYRPISEAQAGRIQSLGAGIGVAGGLAGGILGLTLGSVIADNLKVGTIAATGITIAGGIAGTTGGTIIGEIIGAGLVGYLAKSGGIGAALAGPALGVGVGGAALAAGAGALALGTGVGIGAGINYLNTQDALSIEERNNQRLEALGKAYAEQAKEVERATRERRVRFRDLRPGSATFGQQLFGSEARQADAAGFVRGFDSRARSFSREIISPNAPELTPRNQTDIVRNLRDLISSTPYLQGIDVLRQRASTVNGQELGTGQVFEAFDAGPLQEKINTLVGGAKAQLESLQQFDPENDEAIKKARTELNQYLAVQKEINGLVNQETQLREFGTTDPKQIANIEEYRSRRAEGDRIREERARREEQEQINQQQNALSKLRNTAEGSFRLVYDTGAILAGEDNPFVKVLSDQITLSERMARQWGHLGEEAVKYQETLEKIAISRELNKLEFASYNQAAGFRGQAQRERDERNIAPGLSRREQEYLDIQSAIVDRALEVPRLWKQAAEVLGVTINPLQELRGRIKELQIGLGLGVPTDVQAGNVPIYGTRRVGGEIVTGPQIGTQLALGQRIPGFSAGQQTSTFIGPDGKPVTTTLDAGRPSDYTRYATARAEFIKLSPEVQRKTQEQYADAALSIFGEFEPEQIRRAGLGGAYVQATQIKAAGLGQRIEDARQKAQYSAIQDERLAQQLAEDERFRQEQLRKGRDIRDVGRESDRLLLTRTEGVPVKDLSATVFEARQQALQREAERAISDQQEARQAVERGLSLQQSILENIAVIRDFIISGDMSMLVQVQNDTQARLDQEDLASAHSGQFNTNLDQGSTRTNPYSRVNDRYGKGGIPRGKGGF